MNQLIADFKNLLTGKTPFAWNETRLMNAG
jgi:hypothetical protein